jgi:hypothetical protein
MQAKTTEYGFQWGPATVERGFCDYHKEWVTMIIRTKKYPRGIQVYVTKTGKVRVHCAKGEWKVGAGKTVPNN